jgi:hypothetical protein
VFKCLIDCVKALLVELVLNASTGLNHLFICCDPVLKLCQQWFTKEVFCRARLEPISVVSEVAERLEVI